ncbi:MAG TPA: hypothetical protein VHC97_13665 [Thermoanaerobaculia bacterium]|jgi:hypothetical protein|nr:hypothetical protein [Thermoanaerobaculia bacterium]
MEVATLMRAEEGLPEGVAPPGGIADLSALLGTWFNTDKNTGGVVRMVLAGMPADFTVHAFGAGSPPSQEYDWGSTGAVAYASGVASPDGMAFSATYDFGFVETFLAAYTKSGILVLDTFNVFKDGSGRSNYFSREFFHR